MKLAIDCDIGNLVPGANTDDGLALALALFSKRVDLRSISLVHGNVSVEQGYGVAKSYVDLLGLDVPIYAGASSPLIKNDFKTNAELMAEKYAFLYEGAIKPAEPIHSPPVAANELIKLAELSGDLSILCIGPLTNIAMCMQLDTNFCQNVRQLLIMGGSFDMPRHGVDTNFALDPEAAFACLNSNANIVLAPYNATMQTMLKDSDLDHFDALAKRHLSGARFELYCLLSASLRIWIKYSQLARNAPGAWIHDALPLAWALEPSIATSCNYLVSVCLDEGFKGSCLRVLPSYVSASKGLKSVKKELRILEHVDNRALLECLANELFGL